MSTISIRSIDYQSNQFTLITYNHMNIITIIHSNHTISINYLQYYHCMVNYIHKHIHHDQSELIQFVYDNYWSCKNMYFDKYGSKDYFALDTM